MKKNTIIAIVIIIVCGLILWATTPTECRSGGSRENSVYCARIMS